MHKKEYDGIEVHNRFEAFPDPVDDIAIATYAAKITFRSMEVAGIQAKITEGKIFSEHPEDR